ncbi:MAG TPA: methyltransferase, partial [Casimicrobiaceae bacterium]|nr:methyltransferase [Casimicrobiaceae bacterium]
ADCLRILGSCAKVMSERTKLLVCEKLVPPGNGFNVAKLMDLVMLVQTHGGRERTEEEFRDLFARAGLRLARVVPTRSDNYILEVTK